MGSAYGFIPYPREEVVVASVCESGDFGDFGDSCDNLNPLRSHIAHSDHWRYTDRLGVGGEVMMRDGVVACGWLWVGTGAR